MKKIKLCYYISFSPCDAYNFTHWSHSKFQKFNIFSTISHNYLVWNIKYLKFKMRYSFPPHNYYCLSYLIPLYLFLSCIIMLSRSSSSYYTGSDTGSTATPEGAQNRYRNHLLRYDRYKERSHSLDYLETGR